MTVGGGMAPGAAARATTVVGVATPQARIAVKSAAVARTFGGVAGAAGPAAVRMRTTVGMAGAGGLDSWISGGHSGATRVVRLKRSKGKVVQGCDVYIGRAVERGGWNLPQSKWHNPFTVSSCGSVAEAVSRFETYIRGKPELLAALPELRGRVLGCWCKNSPSDPCHGDVLVRLLNEQTTKPPTKTPS